MEVVFGKPGAVGGVDGGEFAELGCFAGKRVEASFVEVGEGGEECVSEAGGVVDGREVAFGEEVEGEPTAEELEAERRRNLRFEI